MVQYILIYFVYTILTLHRPLGCVVGCFTATFAETVRNGDDELQIGDSVEIFGLQGGGSFFRPKRDRNAMGGDLGMIFFKFLL